MMCLCIVASCLLLFSLFSSFWISAQKLSDGVLGHQAIQVGEMQFSGFCQELRSDDECHPGVTNALGLFSLFGLILWNFVLNLGPCNLDEFF